MQYCDNCTCDSVSVYNGYPWGNNLLAKLCQYGWYTYYVYYPDVLSIEFRSDAEISAAGFQASYYSYPLVTFSTTTPQPVTNYACGNMLTDSSGWISSPSYPNNYPSNAFCTWEIWTSPDTYVEIVFSSLDLETHPTCYYDSVTIFDGPSQKSVELGKICQPGNYTFKSTCNVMSIVFKSDGSVERSGFQAFYTSIPKISIPPTSYSCGGKITDSSGIITSPLYPNNYPNDANCTWEIETKPDCYVKLSFLQFDLETESSCNFDWVIVYDGSPMNSTQLGKICSPGDHIFYSSSNIISINFRSDASVQRTGFIAKYTS